MPGGLKRLQVLFDGKILNVKEAAMARQAEQLTQRYLRYYHHAVPFDRRVVEAAWRRCRGDDCEDRQRDSWRRWSALDGDVPDSSESAVPSAHARSGPAWDDEETNEDGGEVR